METKLLATPYRFLLMGAVVIAACAASYELARSSNNLANQGVAFAIARGNWTFHNIPVRTCSSSYGTPSLFSNHLVKHLSLSSAASIAGELTFYTDSKCFLAPILDPAGWNRSASQGADGSSSISVFPTGVKDPDFSPNGTKEAMVVEETSISACEGCIADLVCPVFLYAEDQMGYSNEYCPSHTPSSESIRFRLGNAESSYGIAISNNPAGISGTVALSGGDYPAVGSLLYSGPTISGSEPSGGRIGCVLSSSLANECNTTVNSLVAALGKGI
jgi:hypothetical protein